MLYLQLKKFSYLLQLLPYLSRSKCNLKLASVLSTLIYIFIQLVGVVDVATFFGIRKIRDETVHHKEQFTKQEQIINDTRNTDGIDPFFPPIPNKLPPKSYLCCDI